MLRWKNIEVFNLSSYFRCKSLLLHEIFATVLFRELKCRANLLARKLRARSFGTIPELKNTRKRRYSCSFGSYSFSEWTEYHSVYSAPDSRMNRMNRIRFTRNTQNTRSFGKVLAGNPTRPPAPVAWLPVGRRSSSQVTCTLYLISFILLLLHVGQR